MMPFSSCGYRNFTSTLVVLIRVFSERFHTKNYHIQYHVSYWYKGSKCMSGEYQQYQMTGIYRGMPDQEHVLPFATNSVLNLEMYYKF